MRSTLIRPDIVLSHLTLTQSWIGSIRAYIPATWTISTEWFFYLAFIASSGLVVSIRRPQRALIALLVLGFLILGTVFYFRTVVVSAMVTYIPILLNRGDLSINVWDWLTYYSPITRMLEFFVGVCCGRLYRDHSYRISGMAVVGAIAWCGVILIWGGSFGSLVQPLLPNFVYAPALAVLLLYCGQTNGLATALSSPVAQYGGEISYSVYLTQGILVGRVAVYFSGILELTCAAIVVVTFVSFITWLTIEVPSRRLLRKLQVRNRLRVAGESW
jgi:peptidoglycan/LPS O-acetylase OafA/YrhL